MCGERAGVEEVMKCGVWIGGRKGLVVRRQAMGVRREGYNDGGEPWSGWKKEGRMVIAL